MLQPPSSPKCTQTPLRPCGSYTHAANTQCSSSHTHPMLRPHNATTKQCSSNTELQCYDIPSKESRTLEVRTLAVRTLAVRTLAVRTFKAPSHPCAPLRFVPLRFAPLRFVLLRLRRTLTVRTPIRLRFAHPCSSYIPT